MIKFPRFVSISILLFAGVALCSLRDDNASEAGTAITLKKEALELANQTDAIKAPQVKKHKYSSKISGSRFSTDNVFGIRIFPANKSNLVNEIAQTNKTTSTAENVLDFRISNSKKNKSKVKEKDEKSKRKDMATASAGAGKHKKEAEDEEERTLAQQVADGKYGLIQNEIFANGSKRPGILSYASNTEVPKDTRDNLGGLEKDEIWLAEDHILVLRGGNYQNIKDNNKTQAWPPIDDYKAPDRQVKIPKNPDIPPPFPVQLSEDGPIEFIKGQQGPAPLPPIIPPLPPFTQDTNKSIPFPFPPPPPGGNKTFPFPLPPNLPPFLNNLPPGATFVAPPVNQTDIDEDDPSIYYPPRYDFYYPQDNTTAVPPGPLVPGIILPPPPDFFSLLENDTDSSLHQYNETDNNINSVTPNNYAGPKYLPAIRKPTRPRISSNRHLKRPGGNATDNNIPETTTKSETPGVAYVFPENSKHKLLTTTTPPQNFFRASVKVPANKHHNGFSTPIFVPSNPNQSVYHPVPTTSPKPNHITLPTTKTLPKQIYIITTPETIDKNRIENIYKHSKPASVEKYELIKPEIHPLRSLIKPNVTVSYNGKYGRLPPATAFPFASGKPEDDDAKPIHSFFVTPPPPGKTSKAPSTDINSITVTPVPVIKKIRIHPIPAEKPQIVIPSTNASKATFYFYEEPPATEGPLTAQKAETLPPPLPVPIATHIPIKNEVTPETQFYYTTKSAGKTPIRQFLEETFHSSNVLPQKPQIGHINNAEILPHNSYSEIQKMKHLNYGSHVSPKPAIKYHYVTEDNTVIIPSPKIKDLEIKNSGSIGLQNVNLESTVVRPAPKPIVVQEAAEPTQKPEIHNPPPPPPPPPPQKYEETSKPAVYNNNDGPFIPSNYYATVRPELIHFTSQEQTLVDDITKNYFTIFGQKINSVSTTPLTPIKSSNEKTKGGSESGLTYISEGGQNYKIQQVHDASGRKPGKSSTVFYTSEKPKSTTPTRPPSNFEKYLKELTGEDQKDYIITGVFPNKIKKGKGFFEPGSALSGIPSHLLTKGPTIFVNGQSPIQAVPPGKNAEQGAGKPRVPPYPPGFSTTLRPVDVEIKPQYIQHVSPTVKPLGVYPQLLPQNMGISHNFQQYIQEITGLTSPTTTRPVRVKNPNLEYFQSTSASPLKPLVFQHSPFQVSPPDVKPKPVSLEGDILVNYKRPRPVINPEAELINVHNPGVPFDVSPNIKIVDSPDLSKNPNQPYSTKQITFGVAKDIFENLPKSGYFSPPHQNGGNSFVSYSLPGNGGHFYFLTPQIVQKENEERRRQEQTYKRSNRSEGRRSRPTESGGYSAEVKHNLEEGFSNHDYLRRSRKKP